MIDTDKYASHSFEEHSTEGTLEHTLGQSPLEFPDEKAKVYEQMLAEAAMQRTSPNPRQDIVDKIRIRRQYGTSDDSKIA